MFANNEWHTSEERGQSGASLGLATLVLGAAIGAAAALIYTSKSAQDLRAQITGTAGSWKDQAAELLAQGRERVITAVEQSRHSASSPDHHSPGGQVHVTE